MGGIFGKQKTKQVSRITEQDKAILVSVSQSQALQKPNKNRSLFYHFLYAQQLKQQRDKLKQYQKRIEKSLEKDRELARKCLQTGRKE